MENRFLPLLCFTLMMAGCGAVDKQPDLPIITSVSPDSATVGELITISGSFLKTVDKVNFGGSASATPRSTSESRLQVVVPKMPTGPTNIDIENPDGKSGTIAFKVLRSIAKITDIVPNEAKRGETVIILGENLNLITTVRFSNDSSSAAQFSLEGTSLKVTVPDDAIPGKVYVSNAEGYAFSDQDFIVLLKPEIISLSSNYGVEKREIEIRGKYLQNALVYFGATIVIPTFNDGSVLKVECPRFSEVKDYGIVVKTTGGEAQHTFTGAPASTISMAVPNGLIPGSALTLKGKDFYDVQAVILPNGSKVNAKEFLTKGNDGITIKLAENITTGNFKIENQYGVGNAVSLNMINGGGGLNPDNIANGPTGIGSVGGISRQCFPATIKDYDISYYSGDSNIDPLTASPTSYGSYSILLYYICYCNSSCGTDCTDSLANISYGQCFDQVQHYGDIVDIGDRSYRLLSGSRCSGGWSSPVSGYLSCSEYSYGPNEQIFLELEKAGKIVEEDVYTGFMMVTSDGLGSEETYFGNRVKSGEYILESTLGNGNKLKITL
jgi:hypothetical protein